MSDEDTPGPIPNPAVKLVSADGTWGVAPWESKSLPRDLFLFGFHDQAELDRALDRNDSANYSPRLFFPAFSCNPLLIGYYCRQDRAAGYLDVVPITF